MSARFESWCRVKAQKKQVLLNLLGNAIKFTEAENEDNKLFGNERPTDYLNDATGPPWGKGLSIQSVNGEVTPTPMMI